MSADRFHYLRGGKASLVVDARPGDDCLPRMVHFGADLGPTPDMQAIASAAPKVGWGARLDQPKAPCVLPGVESGYFGMPAIDAEWHAQWRLGSAKSEKNSILIALASTDEQRVAITLEYRLSAQGVLAARCRVECMPGTLALRWLAALALPLPSSMSDVLSFGGDWAREFSAQRRRVDSDALLLQSRRGRPGHDRFPGLFVGEANFGENHGDVVGVTLGWSGSHRMSVERLREGPVMVQAGELPMDDEPRSGDYQSPWCYAAFSAHGLNGAMQTLHAFLREQILPPKLAKKPRPVHYNTWEAVYFKHDLEVLKELADRAAEVGAERFVLDDGWFKGRNDDRAGIGDWTVDPTKYPKGLKPLIDHVKSRGLEFGLWVEPEMVNPDSELARMNPQWIRRDVDGLVLQRHQAVLDLANPDVREHLHNALNALLSENAIDYLKWDMNRDLTGLGHRAYVYGVYTLMDHLRLAHPSVEIETCASGGGRCDYGMLSRAERVWVSDSNDALDRFDIQRNASLFLPPEISGVHIGPANCHITGRRLSLDLRSHVAMFGHAGLELDLRQLEESELERLSRHIANYKKFRTLLQSGLYWHIPAVGPDHSAIGVSSVDQSEGLYLLVRTGSRELGRGTVIRFSGLSAERQYLVRAVEPMASHVEQSLGLSLRSGNLRIDGRVLAARGLEFYLPRPESSLLLHVKSA